MTGKTTASHSKNGSASRTCDPFLLSDEPPPKLTVFLSAANAVGAAVGSVVSSTYVFFFGLLPVLIV